MKTLEILYQAFRVRYSLNHLQSLLDRGCRIALMGPGDACSILRSYFGEPIQPLDGSDPSEDLIEIPYELDEKARKELLTCDACLVLFPDGPPELDELKSAAEKIPIHVKTLWMCLGDEEKSGAVHEKDLTIPTVQRLPKGRAQERFLKLLVVGLPQVVITLARTWTRVRSQYCITLTRRTAARNGVRAGISSLPLASVPVIGPALSLFATSAETMMLTSSQLRLSFMIAAAHNRPLDFFDRISELWPIVGSAFGFRGVSRTLVRMLPVVGPGVKASVAFAGTYAIGEACRRFYEHGQPSSDEVRRELLRRSHEEGAKEAARLFRKVLAGQKLDELEEELQEDPLLNKVDEVTKAKPESGMAEPKETAKEADSKDSPKASKSKSKKKAKAKKKPSKSARKSKTKSKAKKKASGSSKKRQKKDKSAKTKSAKKTRKRASKTTKRSRTKKKKD